MVQGLKTYIIKTGKRNLSYSGQINLRRFKEHKNSKYPSWFSRFKTRKTFLKIFIINGDFEKQIKRAGVKVVFNILDNLIPAS